MAQDYPIQHIDEYVALPELAIPLALDENSPGRVCRVLAVDFFIALKSDCNERGIDAFEILGIYRCALPAVVLEEGGQVMFYRLPNSLAEWIYELMRDRNYADHFPAMIEFGLRRDEHYARFITTALQASA